MSGLLYLVVTEKSDRVKGVKNSDHKILKSYYST